MVVAAMLCGHKSLSAVAQWGRNHTHLGHLFGFKPGQSPSLGRLHSLLKELDVELFETVLAQWQQGRMADGDDQPTTVSFDGKTLRGSRTDELPGQHLVAAYAHEQAAVIAQLKMPLTTNEHHTALELLGLIPLQNTLILGDAAFTQRDLCEKVIAGGGDYLLTVKGNQPTLQADILAALQPPFSRKHAASGSKP